MVVAPSQRASIPWRRLLLPAIVGCVTFLLFVLLMAWATYQPPRGGFLYFGPVGPSLTGLLVSNMLSVPFIYAEWALVAVALVSAGRRKVFWVPVFLAGGQFIGFPVSQLWHPLLNWGVLVATSLVPAVLLLREPSGDDAVPPRRASWRAIVGCAVAAIVLSSLLPASHIIWSGVPGLMGYEFMLGSLLTALSFVVFGAGIADTPGLWPWAQAAAPGLDYLGLALANWVMGMSMLGRPPTQAFLDSAGNQLLFLASHLVLCFVAAIWPFVGGWASTAFGRAQSWKENLYAEESDTDT
jgi:hypothetical protein